MLEAIEIAAKLIAIAIGLVGKEKATELLSKAAIEQANAAADAIEAVRFPNG